MEGIGPQSERRQVTVVFCDLVGSTTLSTRLGDEELRALLTLYQQAAAREVERYGGHVAQFLGDGILSYFGYPAAFEDAAARAVSASLQIVRAVRQLGARTLKEFDVELQVRIGMHTGIVVFSTLGGTNVAEMLAVGETPNIAAHVQHFAESNGILMTASTAELVQSKYRVELKEERLLKGMSEPVALYTVREERGAPDAEVTGRFAPMVDREAERPWLMEMWASARAGRGGVVLVCGPAGIGKSRLVHELRTGLSAELGEERREFRASQHHQEGSLYPFLERLRLACRFEAHDTADERWAKLESMVGDEEGLDSSDVPVLAALLEVPPPAGAEAVNPLELKERTHGALTDWVLAAALRSPLLVIFEDLHWLDPSSLEVLTRIADRVPGAPVLVAMTARPEFEPPWTGDDEPFHTLNLDPLKDGHVAQMIENLSGGKSLPPQLVSDLVKRVDGVPIFAEELTKNVLGSDLLREEAGAYLYAEPDARAEFDIPTTLQGSLLARLDRLGGIRHVAQVASVLGRSFTYESIQSLSGLHGSGLDTALTTLVEEGVLVESHLSGGISYSFRHALLRDAAYQSLVGSARRSLHAKMGAILSRQLEAAEASGASDGRLVRLLAHHWSASLHPKRPDSDAVRTAVGYLIQAGERELAVSGYAEAAAHLGRALDLIAFLEEGDERDDLELRIRFRMSRVHQATVGWASDVAREGFSRCLDLCLRLGARPELSPVLFGFWQYHLFRAQYPKALQLAEELHTEAVRVEDENLLMQARVALSNSQFWLCQLEEAVGHADFVLERYDPAEHAAHAVTYGMDPGVYALMFAVWVPWLMGRPETALDRHYELIALSARLDHPFSMALALNTSCCFDLNRGDLKAAERSARQLIGLSKEHGLPVYDMFGVLFHGWALARDGRVDEVIEGVHETYRNYATHVGGLGQTYAALMAGDVLRIAGRLDEALEIVEAAIETAEREACSELAYHAELVRLKAQLTLARWPDRLEVGESLLVQAHDLAIARDEPPFRLRAAIALLELADQSSAPVEPEIDRVRRAVESFREKGQSLDLASAERLLTRYEMGAG